MGIDLREVYFSYGEIYVACSRIGATKVLDIQQQILLKKKLCVEFSS
jgi:hypothetical protein